MNANIQNQSSIPVPAGPAAESVAAPNAAGKPATECSPLSMACAPTSASGKFQSELAKPESLAMQELIHKAIDMVCARLNLNVAREQYPEVYVSERAETSYFAPPNDIVICAKHVRLPIALGEEISHWLHHQVKPERTYLCDPQKRTGVDEFIGFVGRYVVMECCRGQGVSEIFDEQLPDLDRKLWTSYYQEAMEVTNQIAEQRQEFAAIRARINSAAQDLEGLVAPEPLLVGGRLTGAEIAVQHQKIIDAKANIEQRWNKEILASIKPREREAVQATKAALIELEEAISSLGKGADDGSSNDKSDNYGAMVERVVAAYERVGGRQLKFTMFSIELSFLDFHHLHDERKLGAKCSDLSKHTAGYLSGQSYLQTNPNLLSDFRRMLTTPYDQLYYRYITVDEEAKPRRTDPLHTTLDKSGELMKNFLRGIIRGAFPGAFG